VRKRMFTGTSTAPIFMTANIASIHSGRLTIQSAALLPWPMPSASSPFASACDPCVDLGEGPPLARDGERLARSPRPGRALGQRADGLLRVAVAHDRFRRTDVSVRGEYPSPLPSRSSLLPLP
jgi:hypothetical protein